MKRFSTLLVLLAVAALPAAAPVSALPMYPTCFGEQTTPNLSGDAGPNVLYGTPGDDVIFGWAGDDTIYGMGGSDRICGGAGNDRIYGGPGGDSLNGDWENDRVYGEGGDDGYLLGGDGNDLLVPGSGDINFTATIEGGAGRDRIVIGQAGYNEVFGGAGRDTIDFRQSARAMAVDLKWGEYGNQFGAAIIGGRVFEVEDVFGTPFDDAISGSAGANRLFGFDAADTIHGRNGDDYIDGGFSVGDWLEGDGGTDTCVDPDSFIVGDECEIWP